MARHPRASEESCLSNRFLPRLHWHSCCCRDVRDAGDHRRRVARGADLLRAQDRATSAPCSTVALGVKNLMDRAPPFSNQPFTRQVGYDPAYADPRGRTFYMSLTLTFK